MTANSKIEWTDHTFNPWIGCQRVGPGCDNCYAESMMDHRLKKVQWGPGAPRERTSAANWRQPLAWNAAHDKFFAAYGRRQRVFCASLADVFDNEVDPVWRRELFALIQATPNLDWLLLTKRIGNAHLMIGEALIDMAGDTSLLPSWPWPNVWLGASIVNQAEADRDIPKILAVPARVRFLSMEPLLGAVDLRQAHVAPVRLPRVDWVIVGGESGSGARPVHPDWVRSLRDQCAAVGVPFLFKQWGEWLPAVEGCSVLGKTLILEGAAPFTDSPRWHGFEGGQHVARVGKKAAGRQLDGMQHDGFPEVQP